MCVLALFFCGCSESTLIRTYPADAKVFVNDTYIGTTPVKYSYPSWSMGGQVFRYRVERDGYLPAEGELKTRISPGRIVAAIFTTCITCFHGFKTFEDRTEIELTPAAGATSSGSAPVFTDVRIYNMVSSSVRSGTCDKHGRCTVADCTGEIVRQPAGTLAGGAAAAASANNYGAQATGQVASAGTSVALTVPGVAMFQCQEGVLNCSLSIAIVDGGGAGTCNKDKYRITVVPR